MPPAMPGMPEFGGIGDRLRNVEREIARINRSRKLESASVGAGGITVKDGGTVQIVGGNIEVLDNGDIVIDGGRLVAVSGATERTVLDRDRLRLNRTDGTRQVEMTPAGGLRLYAANGSTLRTTLDGDGVEIGPTTLTASGLQVGTDVVIDATGLKIDGVLQPAIETIRASGSFQNVSLGTSFTNLVSLNLTIPSFATVVDVIAIGRLQIANTSGGTQSFEARASVAGGATDTARDYADNNLSSNVTATRADRVTGSPSTVNVLLEGRVTSGSNSSNVGRLNVFAVARRVA